MKRICSASLAMVSLSTFFGMQAAAADTSQIVSVGEPLAIPDATLQPGQYQFSVEDRLADRAIIRITSSDSNSHFLLLAVPNREFQTSGNQVMTFRGQNKGESTLRAYSCAECKMAFEVVYPKPQAAKILASSGQTVVAFDPTYDKLPQNLSADDMKVVTLWLASPKRVTSKNRGKGVELAKLAEARPQTEAVASNTTAPPAPESSTPSAAPSEPAAPASAPAAPAPVASESAPVATPSSEPVVSASTSAAAPSEPAAAAASPSPAPPVSTAAALSAPAHPSTQGTLASNRHLPKTASNNFTFAIGGFALIGISGLLFRRRGLLL